MNKDQRSIYVAILVACSNEQNVVHENDAIAIFTENNLQGKQIFIAYFEKENRGIGNKQEEQSGILLCNGLQCTE